MAGEALVQMSMAEEEAEAGDLCKWRSLKRIERYYGHQLSHQWVKVTTSEESSNGDTAVPCCSWHKSSQCQIRVSADGLGR